MRADIVQGITVGQLRAPQRRVLDGVHMQSELGRDDLLHAANILYIQQDCKKGIFSENMARPPHAER